MTKVLTHRRLQSFDQKIPSSSEATGPTQAAGTPDGAPNSAAQHSDASARSAPLARPVPMEQRREQTTTEPAEAKAASNRPSRKRLVLGAAGIAALVAAGWCGHDYGAGGPETL